MKERASDNAAGRQARAGDSMQPDRPYMWPQTWKPLIAAINGFALAGGWSIAQLCDLRIAAADAQLGITETKWSLLPPFATILPKQIGLAATLELCLTAQPISAQRAYDIGFVNQVTPPGEVMAAARTMAQQIAENAPLAVQAFKELAYRGLNMSTPDIFRPDLPRLRSAAGDRGFQGRTPGLRRKAQTPVAGALINMD